VDRCEEVQLKLSQCLHRLSHSFIRGRHEVGSPDDTNEKIVVGLGLDVTEGVYDAGMSTPQEDYGTLGGVEKDGLVIVDGIRNLTPLIQEKPSPGILIVRIPGHAPSDRYPISDG